MLRLPKHWSRPLLQDYPSNSYSAEDNWDGCIEDHETKNKKNKSKVIILRSTYILSNLKSRAATNNSSTCSTKKPLVTAAQIFVL